MDHEDRVQAKEQKLQVMLALEATYVKLGWGHPKHRNYKQLRDLRSRRNEVQNQLEAMGGLVRRELQP
jgi:hypothetical protein